MTKELGSQNRILITGSGGFIGKHLMRAFPEAVGYDIKQGSDIHDLEKLKERMKGVDTVIHLAALSGIQYGTDDCLWENVLGTDYVLKAACKAKVNRVLVASSAAVDYKDEKEMTPYGWSKEVVEQLVMFYTAIPNICVMRFFNVYGPGSKSVVNKFVKAAIESDMVEVHGTGRQTRDYIYIDDLVEAIKFLVNFNDRLELLEIGTGKSTSVRRLVGLIKDTVGTLDVEYYGEAVGLKESKADLSKMKSYGWQPKVSLLQGIKKLKGYYYDR